jgi:hypothetical protein
MGFVPLGKFSGHYANPFYEKSERNYILLLADSGQARSWEHTPYHGFVKQIEEFCNCGKTSDLFVIGKTGKKRPLCFRGIERP